MHSLFLFLALLATAAAAFPVTELIVTQSFLDALANHSIPAQQRDNLATQAILPHLRSFFGPSSTAIDMTPTDIGDISGSIPDQVVDSSCSHKVTAEVSLSYDMPNLQREGFGCLCPHNNTSTNASHPISAQAPKRQRGVA